MAVGFDGGLSVGWEQWAPPKPRALWITTLADGASDPVPVQVDAHSLWHAVTPHPDGSALWVTEHFNSTIQTKELRIYRDDAHRIEHIGTVPSPFTSRFDVVVSDDGELLVVGAEADLTSMFPFVRSLILRLSIRCT